MKRRNAEEAPGIYASDDGPPCTSSSSSEGEVQPPPSSPAGPKKSDLLPRTIFTFVMAITFLFTQYVGQTLGILLVVVCQALMFHEIMQINRKKEMENELPGFKILPWYMFVVCNLFITTNALRLPLVQTWPFLDYYLQHSSFLAFSLYFVGLIAFVLSLKPMNMLESAIRKKHHRPLKQKYFRYQFNQFGWLHMGLLAFSFMSSFFFNSMMEGMIWFTLPVSCVIHNDSWAFACGKLFGSVPLIPTLSPKKTWEGFLGAWFFTTLWALWFSDFLSSQKRFICPKMAFLQPIDCEVSSTFVQQPYPVPEFLWPFIGNYIWLKPVQLHGVAFALFASIGAPFGGFFASGLKRAFNLKDFGDLIPGHGGVIDRMDCQVLMAVFVYCYVSNFVAEKGGVCAAASMFAYCFDRMEREQQVSLFNQLSRHLKESGVKIVDGIATLH